MIRTLKQSLRLSMLQTLLPGDLAEEDVKRPTPRLPCATSGARNTSSSRSV